MIRHFQSPASTEGHDLTILLQHVVDGQFAVDEYPGNLPAGATTRIWCAMRMACRFRYPTTSRRPRTSTI
jgi:hypothetical protein